MATSNDNLRKLYQNGLKHFSLPDFDTFERDMKDEVKRQRFYTNMQAAYSLPDFDTFSKDIGVVATDSPTPVKPATQTPAQSQERVTSTTVRPLTDTTPQLLSVQQDVQPITHPAQPEGWEPSPMQHRAFQMQMDEANARLKKMGEDFHQRMEGIDKGNRPGAFMGNREFNPQTGQMEPHYYTQQGERVGSRMEQSRRNSEYHQWWENNTEAGRRSKEQRLQREFDDRLFHLWERHNPKEGENAAEQAWSAAEKRQGIDRNRIAEDIYHDRGDAMSNAAFLGGRENHIMNAAENSHRSMVAHFTNFDLDRLMNESWDNLGEDGQKALIDDCYQMLRYRNPGADELVLYNQAKQFARQQSDLRLYNLAVEKNMPKGNLEYLMRKIGDMNLLMNVSKGLAVSSADGKTGDMAAYEAANEQYRQDGHKVLDVAGTVAGFALDPTTWLSAGVGGAATKGAMWAGGRWMAGRGATAAVTQAASRQFATSMTGRVVGGIVGGSVNFGTFEGIKEMENQFAHGGKVSTMDENGNLLREGRYVNEGYSASAVGGQAMHGLLMGGAIGWLGPVTGNVSDKLVRGGELFGKAMPGVSSTAGKVMTRAGLYTGATMAEGTIFSVPEWIEGKRDGFDVWTDNMAMMVGFKAKHMLKSAGGVLGDLKASFDSPTNGSKNRLDFESRLRQRMDAPSDGGLALTKDEEAELKRYGYDLRDLVESAERTGNAKEGSLIAQNAPEIVSRLTDMVNDPRVSEAARAKMYYYATGRMLPMSTVMKGELFENEDGGFIVESQGANGVITSRTFKSRKAADLELERIHRQTELNSLELGERYQQTTDFESRLQDACRTVAEENGWDMVEVYRTCEEARRNHLRGGDKQFDEVQQNILRKVTEAMGEFEETGVTDAMRGRINEKHGVDIDAAIRKEANRRTKAEQAAIDEYIAELIPEKAKKNPVVDAEAEDITNQKLLTDDASDFTTRDEEPIDPRFEEDYDFEGGEDPHKPAEQPIGRAVMKFQDRPVEVLSGRVVMTEDGTMVDNERSDASIVIRDIETGKVEMVAPESILSYEEYAAPAEEAPVAQTEPAPSTEEAAQPKYTSGQIKIRNSDGTETRGVLTGYVDENGNHEYYVEGDLQHLHYASDYELDNILSDYQPDAPQEPVEPQQPADRPTPEGVTKVEDYDNGYSFGMTEVQRLSDEALATEIGNLRNNAETLTDFGRGMLEAYEYEQQRRILEAQPAPDPNVGLDGPRHAQDVGAPEPQNPLNIEVEGRTGPLAVAPETDNSVPKIEENGEIPTENRELGTETVPKTEIPVENGQQPADDGFIPIDPSIKPDENGNIEIPAPEAEQEPTPLQRIPRNQQGEPVFEQAESPEVGWDALVEFSEGDAATAKEIADTMTEEKRKAYEKAQKLKAKGKTPTEILASKKANAAQLAQAESEYNLWQRIAGVEQARQNAIRAQQDAEARRLAAERAEAEKAERAAREEAARIEREALEGIPEWHLDNPENARKRGTRRFSGQMFTRQEPVPSVVGNEVEVKFSQKDLPKGRVAVIEASQLQPSHIQGQRNPMFFIDEAQPKNRAEAVSMYAAKEMAEGIRPQEITGSATAYTGAPTVNTRGEVIQGNNRSDALRYLWENNLPAQQQTYKQYLLDNAEQLGIDPEAVNAMQHPVLVNMLDVDDAEAIRLGQMTAQDTESGGIERIKPKNVAQKLGDDMRIFANQLLRSADEEATFGQLVDRNGTDVLKWMSQVGAISNTQYQSAFDSKGNLTAEAKNDLQKVLYQAVFKGASPQLEEMFDKLPAKAQRAILSTAFRDMDSPFAGKMLPEIQASIAAYNQLMSDPSFVEAKNMEQVLRAIEGFKQATALDDRFEQYVPADNFSNFALHLAGLYKASDMSQSTITSYFNQMYDFAQGKKAATLFEEADTTEYPLAEVINKVLNIQYQPAKNGNNNVANGGADVALRNQASQGGELRGSEPPASREQTEAGAEPSERGGRTVLPVAERGGQGNIHSTQRPEPSNLSQTEAEGIDYEYVLSDEMDQNGRPFVLTSKGDLEFGRIERQSGLAEAPILLSEGIITNPKTKEGYGLIHIEARHGKQIRQNGYANAVEFIEDVANNWEAIMEAKDRNGNPTFRLIAKGKHNNTIMVELSGDGTYWNINTAGIFKTSYGKNAKEVYNRHTTDKPIAESVEASQDSELSGTTESSRMNAPTSERKVTNSASDKQEKGAESSVQTSDNKGEQTVQSAVEAASAQVNTTPTPAQAEAGNYKKGHVTIGEFDITIENPAGSVRKGVDADGKEWSNTMANTYGYIKGTEGVDGDHIDVFLHQNMDEWNGRKVYVVDQTNPDGSFDEHKVMLGFNDKDEAMTAYLANYDKTWAGTHPGIRISETNIEDFNKWVQSSHRKTKPFAEYSTVSKVVDEATDKVEPEQPAATIEGEGYKVEPKPYINKQGKTLDTYLVTFDRDFSKEELSALRAKAKALKGWYDRESKGWMLRSVDDAKAFAEEVAAKSEDDVADEAPLSMADMEKSAPKPSAPAQPTESPMKKVDVEGVFDALKTKGETKLSDHATPVEESSKPKKRRWISDEDADEFNSLRDNLRNHFGKGDDVVKESGAEYGQPRPKQMDAEVLRMGTRMTYLMMKGGLRSFSDYCEAMKDELPDIFDDMRPHLKSLYAAAQNMEEVMQLGWDEEMDDRKTVKAFDVYNFDKPGAKDIIATAQHTVDERTSQQQTDQIIQTLKDQRNEQRKKEADETSADTEAVVSKAEATADEIESKLEAATTEQDAERLSRSIDKELEEVNKQLALLGYYEADPVDKDFNEAYGYMRNAERKAVQDAHRLATQLANDLGITIDPKDKVRKSKYGFGSKIARSNVAPAGGEVYITIPISGEHSLSMMLRLDKNEPLLERGRADRYDEDLILTDIMCRVVNSKGGALGGRRVSPTATYDEMLSTIRRIARDYLPADVVKPATPLTPQPGEDMVDMAKRVAKGRTEQTPEVESDKPMEDLFAGKKSSNTLTAYDELKAKHPDTVVLMKVGDFYTTYREDAALISNVLGVTLTRRTNGNDGKVELAGFPADLLDQYLPKLIRAGHRVALGDYQTKSPVVKRQKPTKSTSDKPADATTTAADILGGLFDMAERGESPYIVTPETEAELAKQREAESKTPKLNQDERTDLQPRPEETGRRGQQPRPNEPLGEGAKHEDERTDGGRMAQRGGEHSVSDTGRGAGVSGQHQSERGVTAPRNTRNNHAERGVDYAPKGEKARIDANLAAIELAKKLLATGATATPQEMAILRRYSGWGGLGSAFNEGNAWSPNPINKRLRERIANAENYLERNNTELEAISKRDGQPFKDAEALEKAEEKLAEYEKLMKAEMAAKEAKYAEMDKEVEAASGIELTEEDSEPTASEPAMDYSAENANFANSYETKDGKTVRYTSENPEAYGGLFDFDLSNNVPGADNAAEGGRVNRRQHSNPPLQRRNAALLDTNASDRLNEANGEYCALERKFRESNYMEFTSAEKVESADDVAFIFEELENASVENVFVVMTKRGVPTVMHISIGGFNWSAMNAAPVKLAFDRIKPDKVYFVHNHPSGALNCSAQDVNCLKQIEGAIGKKAEGVIMNLKSGKYGTFDSSGTDSSASHDKAPAPAVQRRLRLYAFDRHVFNPDYQPSANMRSAEDVAKFLSSHRLGDRSKVSVLVCNNQNQIVANVHTTHVSIDSKGLADDIIRAIGEFGGMHAFLYGDFEQSGMVAYRNLTQAVKERSGGVYNLLDVVRIEGNHTWSARDNGYVYEPGSEYGASPEGDIRYREVEDDAVLKEFAEGKTVKAYRTMQVIDGKLYSPMATKVGGKATPEIKLGVPEQAEEHPEIIKRTKVGRDGVEVGYVVIDKGLGKGTLEVAYNPSIHASLTPLNDQFTSADIRPNLVIVETLIPKSELTSGYRAPMAKDAVGEMSWHSGTVSGKLAELGKPRRVILSRYDMPVRIVPFKEVAQMIAAQLEGTNIDIPYNVVTPQVRMELQQLGIAISDTPSGSVGESRDFGKAEYVTDQEIERINTHQQEMAQTSPEAKSHHAEKLAKKFNTPIQVVTDPNELTSNNAERQARMRRSKGFYDPATGKVVVVLPNNANVEDVAETVFHEVVAHKGLREMLGDENYDAFCDEVYDHLKDDLKEKVDRETTRRFEREPEKGYEHHRRVSVDEMFGRMAEKGFEDFTKAERGIWAKLKAKVLEAINKFLGSLKLPKWVKLGDNELRYMLWRSHEKLRTKGDYVDMARDAVKREKLGLSAEARFRDGETGDIWNDRSVGLEERITNAAIRLSNNQSGDLTLRNDAMKAIGGNLTSLRKAMAVQKQFDQSTVKRVADLARILMQNGYLSGMTSGEMQRLISAVKNSVGHAAVKESTQKIMDIMVDNQLRNGEATLRKLLTIRASKVDARGVEVQGMLDVEGQRTMEVVKKAMSLTEDDITDRIAEALNRMSDPDQTIADDAVFEYAGLHMALDYVQNIAGSKAEEKALREGLKTAKEDKDAGRMTEDAYNQFVDATEEAIRKNKIERAEAYFNLVGRLSDSLRGSIENAKAFREAEKARVSEIHHNANSDMEGRPTNEHHKDNWKDKFVNNGFVQFLFAPLGTFDQILRVFGNKSANGEGYLWNRFMRGWVDCRNKKLTGVKEKFARLDEKAAELFGKGKTWGNLIRMEAKMPKATVSFWDGGEMRDHELTQGNLLYIYMVDKMTDGRMKLRRMGITEDDITRIENFLDPRFKTLGDWLQDEFLVDTRNEYNETHKRMFGASMAAIENYFPLKILANARVDKEEDVNQQNRPDGITTKTGSIIKRRVNNLALDITGADALSVILDHITQMEHWSAYAEWNRDLNTLRTYKRFRNQVINMTTVYGGGRKLWENVNDLFLMAAGEYRPPVSKLNKSAVNLAKGVTAAKVSFRMYTALKQLLSAPSYIPEVSISSISKSIINPYGDFKWCMENLPIFRERWHSRISGDPRLLKSDMDWGMWRSRVMEISSRIGMTPNAFVDAVTVAIGARAMYETRQKQYVREGYPNDIAEDRAKHDATILFNQTQQSSESPFLSTIQVDKDWLSSLFSVFRNSSMSYTRQVYDAVRNLKRNLTPGQRAKSVEFMTKQILRDWNVDSDKATEEERGKAEDTAKKRFRRQFKKDVLRIFTFGYLNPFLWCLGPYLAYIVFGNDADEKDKMWDDALTHSLFGSIEGLTGGDVMSAFGNMAASGEWNFNQLSKDMPLASDVNSIFEKFAKDKNAEAINDIINLLVQSGVGMNPQSITDAAVAITDACGDDPALSHEAAIFVMRVLQVPQSQIDKMYFDEIGLSGEEASKLTPEQLAQRYAEYKVKRGTPLAPWSWGDEERLGKYNDLATDRMKERLDAQGDATVIEAYADFEARYKAVSEKAKEAKELMKTDYAAAAQAHAALQQDPDFILYQRFGSLDKQLGRISKMWLTSKSPAEAALVASTISSYRAGMVKVLQAETVESQQSAMSELTTLMNDFYAKYQGMQPKRVP